MSNISKVPGTSTGNLAAKPTTAPLKAEELQKLVDTLPIADQVNIAAGGTVPQAPNYPPVFEKLTARDQAALKELPADDVKEILANVSANPDVAKVTISNRLLEKAKAAVPGIQFENAELFRVSDAAIAFQTLKNTSPSDKARLDGVTFRRVESTILSEVHKGRETDGAAKIEIEKGQGLFGKMGFKLAAMFELWAMTAPLGLMLRAWFPHALSESRNRVIEIGDAQATRMREVLTHEIGHQVLFGKEMDLVGIKEWGKLSGWKGKDGEPTLGVTAEGRLMGFDPSVRPTRTNNFVYENFTEDLNPARIKQTLALITDPELKAEFEQTMKIKQNLRGAIKEIFGVEALGYSMTNPLDDHAESYRAFYLEPELLVRKAPDKFLFINAQSRKFAPDQVKTMFAQAGKDPQRIATALAGTGLAQETVDRIFKANGVSADANALGQQASEALAAARSLAAGAAAVPAFRQAYMVIQQKATEKDLTFINAFTQDPAKALGDLWGKLSPAEQAQFADQTKRVATVQRMQRGQMSYVSAATQGYKDIEIAAIQNFGRKLIDDAGFRAGLQQNPRGTLASVARNLPPELMKSLTDPKMQASFKTFAATIDRLLAYDNVPLLGGGDLREAFERNLKNVNEEALTASMGLLKDDPEKMAKVFVGLEQNFMGDNGGG